MSLGKIWAITPQEPLLKCLIPGYFVKEILFLSLPPAVIATIWRVTCWRAWGSSPHTAMGEIGFVSGENKKTKTKKPGVLPGTRKLNRGL